MGDKRPEAEIEITPEMIAAGVSEICDCLRGAEFPIVVSVEEMAERVFLEMSKHARASKTAPNRVRVAARPRHASDSS